MKKVILIIVLCVIAISGVILVVMYNMGDRLIAEAIRSDLLAEENTTADQPVEAKKDVENSQEQNVGTTNGSNPTTGPTDNSKTVDTSSEVAVSPDANKPKADKPKADKPKEQTKAVLPDVKLNEIKNEVSATDKIGAAALAIKRLSSSDISQLKGMLAGGLSEEELAKAKAMAYARFSEKEIEQIKEMYAKYMK